jgi:hypothetical protein
MSTVELISTVQLLFWSKRIAVSSPWSAALWSFISLLWCLVLCDTLALGVDGSRLDISPLLDHLKRPTHVFLAPFPLTSMIET